MAAQRRNPRSNDGRPTGSGKAGGRPGGRKVGRGGRGSQGQRGASGGDGAGYAGGGRGPGRSHHGGARPGRSHQRNSGGRGEFRRPSLRPQVTSLWDYPSQSYGSGQRGDQNYRGATPAYVIWTVLERFAEPGMKVVDPFCGSGTTLDVCKDLGMDGLGFDVAPYRDDIVEADARSLPMKDSRADILFMDPPYADNLDYSDDPRCIGKLKADGRYQKAMRQVLKEAGRVLKGEGLLAIYVCDIYQKKRGFFPLGFELFQMASADFYPVDHIAVVRHNKTLEMGNYRKAAEEGGFYLRGFNHLMLFRRRPKEKQR